MNSTTEYENTLRGLIIGIIGGSDDAPYKVSTDRIEKWKEKREIENKKYKGLLTEKRLIYFSDFYDLETIILKKNWENFSPVFQDKKRFEVFYKEVEKFRNTVSHGRTLTSSQATLLEGITSDLKNTISIYHNKNEMKDDYFIRITKVSDNLGNIWESSLSGNRPILRVEDDYELIVEANDPKDREIEYNISSLGKGLKLENQKRNRIQFKIPNSLVGENQTLLITAATPSSEYNNEAVMTILITVFPKK